MKKIVAMVLTLVMALSMTAGFASAAELPSEITFVIPYGDTSGTNKVWRAFGAEFEAQTGVKVVYENQGGASGAVGTEYYMNQVKHDGSAVLCMAETLTTTRPNGLTEYMYEDFYPLVLLSANAGILVTYPGSVFDGMGFDEVIKYLQDNPGTTVGSTGVGGMCWIWYTILTKLYGVDLNVVDYKDSGEGNTQLMGKHVELFVNGYLTASPLIAAGSISPIVLFDTERNEKLPDIPAVTEYESAAECANYLPNGSFFFCEVSNDVPDDMKELLREKFMEVANSDAMHEWAKTGTGRYLALTGDEANAYVTKQRAINCYLLYDTGVSETDPATYGVERP